jgi:hypothetical protein
VLAVSKASLRFLAMCSREDCGENFAFRGFGSFNVATPECEAFSFRTAKCVSSGVTAAPANARPSKWLVLRWKPEESHWPSPAGIRNAVFATFVKKETPIMKTSLVTASKVGRGSNGKRRNCGAATLLCSLAAVALLCVFSPMSRGGQTSSNSIAFSETYADKVHCVNDGEGDIECDEAAVGAYHVVATVSLAGVDISQFDGDTPFELIIGNVDLLNVLSDDPKYSTDKTSATFAYTTSYWDDDGNDHTVKWGTVKLRWNAKTLTVNASFKNNSDWDDGQYVLADEYDGDDSGPITDTTYGEIDFADAVSVSFSNVSVTGTIKTRDVTARDGSDYTLSTIKIKGVGTE